MIRVPIHRLDSVASRFRCDRINQEKDVAWFAEEPARSRTTLEEIRRTVAAASIDSLDHNMDRLELDVVTPRSINAARMATYVIASYFRREFHYDFIQYHHDEADYKRDRVFLWTQNVRPDHRVAVGAICFRWRDDEDAPAALALAWLWIHPFLRQKGILTGYWPFFRQVYGDFHVEPPILKATGSSSPRWVNVLGAEPDVFATSARRASPPSGLATNSSRAKVAGDLSLATGF